MLDNWLPFLIYAVFALIIPASMMWFSFALTSSWSWRATAPARRLYDWYLTVTSRTKGERP